MILGLSTTQDVLGEGEMEGGKKRSRVIELAVICEDAGILSNPGRAISLMLLNQGGELGVVSVDWIHLDIRVQPPGWGCVGEHQG